jgi:hypothetical protein
MFNLTVDPNYQLHLVLEEEDAGISTIVIGKALRQGAHGPLRKAVLRPVLTSVATP